MILCHFFFKANFIQTVFALFQLDDSAFSSLNVRDDHYENVEELNLSDNNLENLSDKLLKMNLRLSFRAKNNRLTSVSHGHLQLADSGFLKNLLHHGGMNSTVFWAFEDLKFKISEGYDQNWCFPDSAQIAVSV